VEHNQHHRETRRTELIAERQSIANEIHDSLAQTLMYARMRANLLIESIRGGNELTAVQYAQDIDETLESCQKTVRTLITDFRCEIDPAGLLQALNVLAQQFTTRHGIALEYVNRVADLDLTLEFEIQIFHIVREALANIATHSNATHARLIIDSTSNDFVFTIEDNGRGGYTFTPIEGHYGMMIMRERAARIGGEIKIESSEGLGTLVQLFLPNSTLRGGGE
jgi:two-component system nitrate/nitrite sensor histidine kinase NarX